MKENCVVANAKVVYLTFIDGSRFVVNVGRDFIVNAIGEEVPIGQRPPDPYSLSN